MPFHTTDHIPNLVIPPPQKVIKSGYSPGSEPALKLHSRARPRVGGASLLRWSQHRKKFQKKADNKKKVKSVV